MQIVIAGGTGLLGTALTSALRADGHQVTVLTRRAAGPGQAGWSGRQASPEAAAALERADAVVNLAGSSIAGGRWTAGRKADILASRVEPTRALSTAIRATGRPVTFLSSSAVGYYGCTDDTLLDERSPAGADFLAGVCRAWEDEARAAGPAARVVLLRTGIVLSANGGALPQLALPFRVFAGGPSGSGRQYMSWIHEADWVAMARWALATPAVSGPVNATAPEPVTNRAFAAALGRALHRPSWLPAPAFALRLALGEMADALVLGGQRVLPRAAIDGGFRFLHTRVDDALRAIYAPAAR